ncbi:protein of unknown function UPF0157 [Glarea lozoyensis ATCC 20868]|uniref:Uncharacterized protein n=2 Tax=Glarea lozoyensis TaxID=101852 RepID=S3E6I7_GLAL2|nr:protein of unknown function UPF0157 [Glarea lozoyensis ATCC 20868]EPE33993.1 protein of unknown function UPF0157 [Glarea lozoyensis ATCC 20868]
MPQITILPHNPLWLSKFEAQKKILQEILASLPILSIQHVGSTSIPSLPAKPVLDIDIIVQRSDVPLVIAALVAAGYTDLGTFGIADRWALRQPGYGRGDEALGDEEDMRMNTYVIVEGSLALRNHLDVKRVLCGNEGLRREYADTKRRLVEQGVDLDGYVRGKNEVLLRVLGEAGWSEGELEEVRRANE